MCPVCRFVVLLLLLLLHIVTQLVTQVVTYILVPIDGDTYYCGAGTDGDGDKYRGIHTYVCS